MSRRFLVGAVAAMIAATVLVVFLIYHRQAAQEERDMASRAAALPRTPPETVQRPKPLETSRAQPQPESAVAQTSRSVSEAHRKPAVAPHESVDTAAVSAPAPPMTTTTESATRGFRHRGKYNIIVNDAMQRADADEIASRLQKLGYNTYLVPTRKDGEASWMVRVGPYQTAAEANAAQQELNQKYHSTYPSAQ
jgi:cell division septation protein DedD